MVVMIKPMTHDEKVALYMKSTKAKLAEMLANSNEEVTRLRAMPAVRRSDRHRTGER